MFSLFSSKKKSSDTIIPQYQNPNIENQEVKTKLTALAAFIQNEVNINTIFSGDQHGGELDFTTIGHFNINKDPDNKDSCSKILEYAMKQYNNQLQKLQTTDFKLGLSFVIGVVAIALSPLSAGLSFLVAAAAFSYFGYQLKHRESVREDYTNAQQDMTNVYIWAMNDIDSIITQESHYLPLKEQYQNINQYAQYVQKSFHPQITAMHELFNPMLSDQNIWHYTRNDLDEAITIDKSAKEENAVENETTTKLQLSTSYLLYGQHQGNTVQVAKGLAEIIRRAVVGLGVSIYSAFSSDSHESEQEQFSNIKPVTL